VRADLQDTRLRWTNLTGADLTGALLPHLSAVGIVIQAALRGAAAGAKLGLLFGVPIGAMVAVMSGEDNPVPTSLIGGAVAELVAVTIGLVAGLRAVRSCRPAVSCRWPDGGGKRNAA
jgi:hypothetical protein